VSEGGIPCGRKTVEGIAQIEGSEHHMRSDQLEAIAQIPQSPIVPLEEDSWNTPLRHPVRLDTRYPGVLHVANIGDTVEYRHPQGRLWLARVTGMFVDGYRLKFIPFAPMEMWSETWRGFYNAINKHPGQEIIPFAPHSSIRIALHVREEAKRRFREQHPEAQLPRLFEIGDVVEYFAPKWKRWIPGVIKQLQAPKGYRLCCTDYAAESDIRHKRGSVEDPFYFHAFDIGDPIDVIREQCTDYRNRSGGAFVIGRRPEGYFCDGIGDPCDLIKHDKVCDVVFRDLIRW
jgi:hypothetical protein